MPVYDYKCAVCRYEKRDVYKPLTTSPAPECCEEPMKRLVTIGARSGWGADLWSFFGMR